jgi:hypothetical protein
MMEHLAPLDSPTERAALRLKRRVLDGPEAFWLDYLTGKGWAVESASHFAARDVNLLSSALRGLDVESCFASSPTKSPRGPSRNECPPPRRGSGGSTASSSA